MTTATKTAEANADLLAACEEAVWSITMYQERGSADDRAQLNRVLLTLRAAIAAARRGHPGRGCETSRSFTAPVEMTAGEALAAASRGERLPPEIAARYRISQ